MNIREEALRVHCELEGKLSIESKMKLNSREDLSIAYTPGVAEPCKEIAADKEKVYNYTMKGNTVAVVTNGTAVLGLGNIGAEASLPVMEGKAVLFKEFGDVNAFPICINSEDPEEIINTVKLISPGFGGINLEDIKAPECFYIEERLKKELDIPVFHDDQHGTAIVCLAGIYNALKVVEKKLNEVKIVINGAGAAGTAICKLLIKAGAENIVMCDINGALVEGDSTLSDAHKELAKITNRNKEKGKLEDIIKGADLFIGVSAANVLKPHMVESMDKNAVIFAMANPNPEIMPDLAKEAGARVVATGRSDFPNQINNVLVFPGIFKGALECRAKGITDEMKLAAARGLADMVSEEDLCEEYIIPNALNKEVADSIAEAVRRYAE
ncbi:NAD(P)-dependent malic enzyme [Oceanirhabdus sp. W0125-5]|uniref:NAD(P)-dependent malic enzyme n=1 Tax=Oceanirhabdus sp. W0125-5 TaxID=2999116 RepID=UPI0022F2E755|nr:NADP-dependent malic enzyme [Oceanirhabdus sp. W0125-5]WBW98529.1 NADP-dependent malic enzyme [Oceanirhabdus sp. W0125-5]